ncbi:SBBP repeat-containing protein [Methanobacterium sp.]|uniref:SBBP repeat-containing protein n=1 Tax=Methanobacterium sp. TaxID=2164 RepID=UPI003C7730EB
MKTKITALIISIFFALIICGAVSATNTNYTVFSNESSNANAITVDNQGNVYVTGSTSNTNFTKTDGTYTSNSKGNGDIFIGKYASNGTLIFSTYFGGSNSDMGNGITVDKHGNIYITGQTKSTDFPTTSGAYQTSLKGGADAFIVKLSSDGSTLLYSTYFGGSSTESGGAKVEIGNAIKVDGNGNIYITGTTSSDDFPTTTGAHKRNIASSEGVYWADAFVTKFNSNWNLVYSTLLGGNTSDEVPYGIVIDSKNNAWISGKTLSSDFPTTSGACQTSLQGATDAFISKFNSIGTLIYSTYFGGTSNDYGYSIAVDNSDNIYITGQTTSTNLPVTTGVYQTARKGPGDTYVAKFNSSGSLVFCTYFGGSGLEDARSIAVDSQGNIYITGRTSSVIPMTANAVQTSIKGGTWDAFTAKLNSSGTALLYGSLLGGKSSDFGYGVAVDNLSNVYIAGLGLVLTKIATAPTVNINQTGGLFNTNQNITLNTSDSTDTIYYTTDGSDPQTSSTRITYNGPIVVINTITLRYTAVDSLGNWSPIYNETYTIDKIKPVPKANLPGGSYNTIQTVNLSATDDLDSNPKIYYTLDGSTPTTSSKLYDGPITITDTTTLKFIAVDEIGNLSPVYTETYNIKSDVYVNVTPSKTNPQVGDKVTYKFKLGNNGPGVAKDVLFTYVIPEGLEFTGANVDQGTWTYNESTRALTWNVGNVTVGDPYLWLNLKIISARSFNIQPNVSVTGYNPELQSNIGSLLVNIVSAPTNNNGTNTGNGTTSGNGTNTVKAATQTTTNTVPMQDTGLPIAGLAAALLLVGSGLTLGRKK